MDTLSSFGGLLDNLARATKSRKVSGQSAWNNRFRWECARFVHAWTIGDAQGATIRVILPSVVMAVVIGQWYSFGTLRASLRIFPFLLFVVLPMFAGAFTVIGLLVCKSWLFPVWLAGEVVWLYARVTGEPPHGSKVYGWIDRIDQYYWEHKAEPINDPCTGRTDRIEFTWFTRGSKKCSYVWDIIFMGWRPWRMK